MLYEKYRLFDDGVEIMIPSEIKPAGAFAPSPNSWLSKDRRTVINAAMGVSDLTEDGIDARLNDYYKSFCRYIRYFECLHIRKRDINRRKYGEIQYLSKVSGYGFYNIFLLGSSMDREFTVTIQCMERDRKEYVHIFDNISDSIRILKKHIFQIKKQAHNDGNAYDNREVGVCGRLRAA